MKKRIDAQEVEVGMYISELDRPWLETPFLFQGFEVTSDEDIRELQRYCKYVYIDVERSDTDSLSESGRRAPVKNIGTPAEEATTKKKPHLTVLETKRPKLADTKKLEFEILKKNAAPRPPQTYQDQTSLEEELERVKIAHDFARTLIPTIMEDVRMGRSVKIGAAKKVVGELTESIIRNPDALICFSQLKHKDAYTAEHSLRVCILALAFGRQLGLDRNYLNLLGMGALLHDIGKMKISNDILNKPAELTEEEAKIMEEHVPYGVKILEPTNIPRESIEVARGHHERYDGTGYKSGRKGDAIGQFGLIGGIVDFYDALTSNRPYRQGQPAHLVLRDMYRARNKLFHPELIEQFIQCMGVYPIGSVVELNTGDVGVVITLNRVRRLKPRVALVLQPDNNPYPMAKTIDLVTDRTSNGGQYEISSVSEPEKYNIYTARYIPAVNH